MFVLENSFIAGFKTGNSNTININVTAPNDVYMLSYAPIDDAFLAGTTRLSSSNGSAVNIRPNSPNPISIAPIYRGYFKFDIPTNIQGQITDAELILSEFTPTNTGTITVYEGDSNNWSETCIGSIDNFCSGNNMIPNKLTPAVVSETYNGPVDGISIPSSVISNGTFTLILESDTNFSFWSNIGGSFAPPELKLTVYNRLAYEAECASVGPNWIVHNHPSASNGASLVYPDIGKMLASPSTDTDDIITFWSILEADTYNIYVRHIANSSFNDEYFARFNNGTWIAVPPIPKSLGFRWSELKDASGNIVDFVANTGLNIFDLGVREDGIRIDEIVFVPVSKPHLIPVNPEIINLDK